MYTAPVFMSVRVVASGCKDFSMGQVVAAVASAEHMHGLTSPWMTPSTICLISLQSQGRRHL